MLKRVLGALLCVVGLVVAGLAVASATVWRAPDTLTASATSGAPLVVTEPGVLDLAADEVTVRAEADGTAVVIALGRTVDVEGWVGESPATTVTGLADRTTLATSEESRADAPQPGTATPTAPSPEAPEEGAAEEGAAEEGAAEGEAEEPAPAEGTPAEGAPQEAAPDPRGSDLWVEEVSGEGSAELRWDAEDGRWSVLVASVDPAVPPTVTLSWPQTVTTPWLVPGLVVGGLLLLGGAALLLLGMRRPRDGGAGPTAAPAASGPAATAPAVADPGADAGRPLTRRELRELQARGAAPTPRVGPATPPPGDLPPGVPPAPVPGDTGVPGPGGQVPGRGAAARPGAPGGDVPVEGASSDGASADGASPQETPRDAAARPEGRGGRLLPPAAGRLGPRRTGTAAPRPEASGSPATGDAGGTPPAGPPAGRPSPGASAWRQTWGLPAGDTTAGDTTAGDTTAGDTTAGGPAPRPGTDASDPAPRTAEAEPDGSTTDDGGDR